MHEPIRNRYDTVAYIFPGIDTTDEDAVWKAILYAGYEGFIVPRGNGYSTTMDGQMSVTAQAVLMYAKTGLSGWPWVDEWGILRGGW